MRRNFGGVWIGAALALMLAAGGAPAETESAEARCLGHEPGALAGEFPDDGRQYAPHRLVDYINIAIDVTPDFEKRTVAGKTTLRFAPLGLPLAELRLDAIEMAVATATSTAKLAGWQATEDKIILTFDPPIPPGQETTVSIAYSAEPQAGLYFRTPAMGYREGDAHIFTQGETFEARHWFPCFDSPNEKLSSEVICRVPEGMTALSNGKKVSEQKDAAGLTAIHWVQEKPHTVYLIALCAGYFEKIEEDYRGLSLAFWTPPSYIKEAPNSYRHTKDMMAFFEEEIGVAYPWDKYHQVVVDDFVAGGMENTGLTILTTRTLFSDEIENTRNSEGLVAHELAHQWFGDLVTCKDWSHLWLNEGFASYYDALYAGHLHGADMLDWRMLSYADAVLGGGAPKKPIVTKKFTDADDQFSALAYDKGAWVVHMLRSQLGAELYRKCIETYLERHRFQTVATEDLISIVEELSGRSFERFFDQWTYHIGAPELRVRYEWLAREKLAKVSVAQTQEIGDEAMLFDFPLRLRFKGKGGAADRDVLVNAKTQDFFFPLADAPEIVRADPDYELLAKIEFDLPAAMLRAQLADKDDAIGRIFAARGLAGKADAQAVAALKAALAGDAFFGVRVEAARALRKIGSPAALAALIEAKDQPDARARRARAEALAALYSDAARDALLEIAANEKNPSIAGVAVRGLGRYSADPRAKDAVTQALSANSYAQERTAGAFDAIRTADDPSFAPLVQKTLAGRANELPTFVFTSGLGALGYVARTQPDRAETRAFLSGYLQSPRLFIRSAAIGALGVLGDPAAIAQIEPFANRGPAPRNRGEASVARAAQGAVKSLQETKKVPVEMSDLRGEVTSLKKANEDLKKEVEEIRKKIDAAGTGAAGPKKKRGWRLFGGAGRSGQ